jgi:hypothetical protein
MVTILARVSTADSSASSFFVAGDHLVTVSRSMGTQERVKVEIRDPRFDGHLDRNATIVARSDNNEIALVRLDGNSEISQLEPARFSLRAPVRKERVVILAWAESLASWDGDPVFLVKVKTLEETSAGCLMHIRQQSLNPPQSENLSNVSGAPLLSLKNSVLGMVLNHADASQDKDPKVVKQKSNSRSSTLRIVPAAAIVRFLAAQKLEIKIE